MDQGYLSKGITHPFLFGGKIMADPVYKVFVDHFKSQNSFCLRISTDNQKLAMDGYKNFHAMHSNVVVLDLTNMFDAERIKKENLPEQCLIMSMDNLGFDIEKGRWYYKLYCYGTFNKMSTIKMIERHYQDLYFGVKKDD